MRSDFHLMLPGERAGAPLLACRLLSEGSGGEVWRVSTTRGHWVFKRRKHRDFAVDLERMLALQNLAADSSVAPRLLSVDPSSGTELGEFATGRSVTPNEFARPVFLLRVAGRMSVLHGLPLPAAWSAQANWYFDVSAHLSARCRAVNNSALSSRLRDLPHLLAASGAGTRANAVLHLDIHAANVRVGTDLILLDWEYAALGDPIWDLASLTATLTLDDSFCGALLAAAGRSHDTSVAQLLAARELFQWLNELWQLSHGPDVVCAGSLPAI